MPHILITGCNRGIGKALAEAALEKGWQVTGTARQAFDPGYPVIPCEMSDIPSFAGTLSDLAPLDILINNAGVITPKRQSTLDMDFEGFQETLTINTLAPLAFAQACLPALRKSAAARVLSISSQMSRMGYRASDRIAYRASKSALNKVMQGLATDLEPEGIAVALINPGWVKTDMGGEGAELDAGQVASGVLDVAENLTIADTGKFFQFSGEECQF